MRCECALLSCSTPSCASGIRQGVMSDITPSRGDADLDEAPNLTAQDVAAITGLSYHAVLRAIYRGELAAYKPCGRIRVRKRDLLAWIEASRVQLERASVLETPPPPAPGSLEALRQLERRAR